jgi:hypothetical protein
MAVAVAPTVASHASQRGGQGRDAIGPDIVAVAEPEGLHHPHRSGLQPMDAGGFLVALDLAEADADQIAGLHHLPAGLGEAAFVAIPGRDAEEARQPEQQAERDEPEARPSRLGQPVEEGSGAHRAAPLARGGAGDHEPPPRPGRRRGADEGLSNFFTLDAIFVRAAQRSL